MPRPRHIDDDSLLDAAGAVLAENGAPGFTLERAADRATVSPATLIKRFGSKKHLLLALNQRWLDGIEPGLAAAADAARTPLDRVRAVAVWGVADLDDPRVAGTQLVALSRDLADPDLRAQLADGLARIRKRLAAELERAGEELPSAPAPQPAAELLAALVEGIKITWSVQPEQSLLQRVHRDVDIVLRGWQRGQGGRGASSKGPRGR